MKILIIGGSGLIGTNFLKHFRKKRDKEVEFTYFKTKIPFPNEYILDITENDKTVLLISKINPDVVIHTAAITNVDLSETNKELADSINVNGTKNVVDGCKITKSKLVYISAPLVFDGKKPKYLESDSPSPATYYGITKFKGEKLVKNSNLSYLILRTDQPYCWSEPWNHTNSVLRVLDKLRAGKEHNEIIDWMNTPTYIPDFVDAASQLLDYNATGIYHLVGSDYIDRYKWSLLVAEIFGLNKNLINPITSDKLNLAAKRVNVNLSNRKLHEKTGFSMKGVKEGLLQMRKESII